MTNTSRQVLQEKIRHLETRLSAFAQTTILLGETSVDYLSVLSKISDGVYLLDEAGRFVFVNAAIVKRSGIPLEEFIGLHFLDIIAEEYHERVRRNFFRVMSGEKVPPYELAYVTRSGKQLLLEVNTQAVYKNGDVVGLLGVSRDITKRKKAEQALEKAQRELEQRVEQRTRELARANAELRKEIERRKGVEKALRESQHLLRTVFDSAQDCIFVKDRKLRYTLVNRCMERLFGKPASALVGKTDQKLFGKEAAAHMAQVDKRVLEGQVCEAEDTKPVNNTMTTFHVVKVPIYDGHGTVTGLCGIARDTTRRKQEREALRQSEATVKALLNAATEVIMLTDTQGSIIALNRTAAKSLQKDVDEAVGCNVFDLLEPEIARSRKAIADRVLRSKKPLRFQDERRGRHFDTNVYPVLDEQGEVVQLAAYGREITEQKRILEKLQRAYDDVECLVEKRTKELSRTNRRLAREIEKHKQTEKELTKKKEELKAKAAKLEELNTALRVLLKRRETDRSEIEERVIGNVKDLVLPYLEKIKATPLDSFQRQCIGVVQSNIMEIISPFSYKLSSRYLGLTPTEIRVAGLVKDGKRTKEIASFLNLSTKTIEFHRDNIRKKLGIKNSRTNLRTYLLAI